MLYVVGIFFEGYKILPSHSKNRLDLRKIWTSKVLGQQKSQFWDSHLGLLGKSDIWMYSSRRGKNYNIGKGVVPPLKGCGPCKTYVWGCPYLVGHNTFIRLTLITFFSWLCKLISFWTFSCEFILVPSQNSNMPSYPPSVVS
jgi:hypothetical protein